MRRKILNIVLIVSLMIPAMPVHATEVQEELASVVEEPVLETIIENDETITVANNVAINASNFPDANFRECIKSEVDNNSDGVLSATEISSKWYFYISYKNINSLKGIEFFTNLVGLYCNGNAMTELDVSKCTNLKELECSYNSIAKLNISGCTKLEKLNCKNNKLTVLDVSHCPQLTSLSFGENKISKLGDCVAVNLTHLECEGSGISELDVSRFPQLAALYCSHNNISKLDVSNLTKLRSLECEENNISKLDVSNLTELERLVCSNNNISNLDVSKLTKLEYLQCFNNSISNLDTGEFTKLKELMCKNNNLIELDVSKCTNLIYLQCNSNKISKLNVSNCQNLQNLNCGNNEISELNVGNCAKLEYLDCANNNLRNLEINSQSGIKNVYSYSFIRSKSKQFDFSKYASFNPAKVKKLNGLTLSGKVFTLTDNSYGSGSYEYDCGNGNVLVVNLRYVKDAEAFVSKGEFPAGIKIDKLPENNYSYFVNQGYNEYAGDHSTSVIDSYLTINEDNTYTRISNSLDLGDYVYLEKYSNNFQLLSAGRIKKELPIFGGFFDDGQFYYLVFGQNNLNEDDGTEVFRIVKYSHNWTRLDAASLYGADTTEPFEGGTLRFDIYDGHLYIRTCHLMYTADDGLNHQANVSMKIRIADMGVSDMAYDVSYPGGYVSHSFNQFVKADNGIIYTLDQGDGYPRAAVLHKGEADMSFSRSSWESLNTLFYSNYADIAYQHTFATLGGLEISDYMILTAGSSAPQDGVNRYYNIYITTTDKKNFSDEGTKIKWITNYTNGNIQVGNPYLVEINKNKYMLMWTEKDAGTYDGNLKLKYVLLDGKGNMLGNVVTRQGVLSDCCPIYDPDTNRIIWYVVNFKDELSFYTIEVSPQDFWPFTDVAYKPGNWKYEAVKYVYDNKIMNGVGDGTRFDPDAPLTREMFATVLYRMAGEPAVTYKRKFPDVPGGKWYSNAVIWASEQGIVSGYGSGNFGTGHYITREQISKMLMEYGDKQGYDVSQSANFNSFADAGKVSGWAKDYMKWAVGSGMIGGSQKNGKYYLNPQGNATRAECATMLKRFMEKYQ